MKKTVSLLLCLVLVVFALAGCEKRESYQPTNTLIVSSDAAVRICYNEEGLVTAINAVNEEGNLICSVYSDYKEKACTNVVQELLKLYAEHKFLRVQVTLIPSKDASVPTADFLEKIHADAVTAADGIPVTLITQQQLDAQGYISLGTATDLLKAHLGIGNYTSLIGDSSTIESHNCYGFFVEHNEEETFYAVNAVTGQIIQANYADFYNSTDTEATEDPLPDAASDPEFTYVEDPMPEIDPDYEMPIDGNTEEAVPVTDATVDPASTEPSYNISE